MIVNTETTKYFTIIFLFLFFSCTPSPRYTTSKNINSDKATKANSYKTTKSKKKYNKKQKSSFNPNKKKYIGISSYYGKDFHGKLTANGEVYDMYGLTAAHKTFPLNTVARVTNLKNGKSLYIRINDRGPYVDGRILDCSYGAAKKLDFLQEGTTEVEIRVIEWGDDEYMHHK